MEDKNKMEEEEAKKIVESITDSITSGEKKDIEEVVLYELFRKWQ